MSLQDAADLIRLGIITLPLVEQLKLVDQFYTFNSRSDAVLGLMTTHKQKLNEDLLSFLQS